MESGGEGYATPTNDRGHTQSKNAHLERTDDKSRGFQFEQFYCSIHVCQIAVCFFFRRHSGYLRVQPCLLGSARHNLPAYENQENAMTDSSNQKTSLDDLKTKIDIVAPLVQESYKVCFEYMKLLLMISITLDGGAIMLVANNKMEDVYIKCIPFVIAITISLVFFIAMIPANKMSSYIAISICTAKNFQKSLSDFQKTLKWTIIPVVIAYLAWGASFLIGVNNVFGSILDFVMKRTSL
ncbi:MAG: hypothetical protein II989_02025 [Bacteroidales bacterium]|nr:hypothetical protein [Bacteroidales bacterium]